MTWILLLVIAGLGGTVETRIEIQAVDKAECVRFGMEVARRMMETDPMRFIAIGIGCSEKPSGEDT